MKSLFAMRRANGDWFALDDHGRSRVPIFRSITHAMLAHSRDAGMECFRPVVLDEVAFKNLTTTDQGQACFWLIEDPLVRLNQGRPFDHKELARFMKNGDIEPAAGRSK